MSMIASGEVAENSPLDQSRQRHLFRAEHVDMSNVQVARISVDDQV
jgi:hypothetical protein